MNRPQKVGDVLAIGLSSLCLLHCLALPLAIALAPSLSGTFFTTDLSSEAFHILLLALVIPMSIFSLTLGCQQHRNIAVVLLGGSGLTLLISALFIPEKTLWNMGEPLLTTAGSIFIALAHLMNFKLCGHTSTCECSESKVPTNNASATEGLNS